MNLKKIAELLAQSGIPRRHQADTFADWDPVPAINKCDVEFPDVLECVKAYVDNAVKNYESGKGVILVGPTGSGKTRLTWYILTRIIERYTMSGFYVNMADFTRACRDQYDRVTLIDKVKHFDFVAIDDLADVPAPDWVKSELTGVIDFRWRERKPTIVNTMRSLQELESEKFLGAYLFYRLYQLAQEHVLELLPKKNYREGGNA